jgi:hypothetical protein
VPTITLLHVTIDAAGDGHDVVNEIGGTHAGGIEAEDAELIGEQQENPGNAAHGSEGRYHQRNQGRGENPGVNT